MGSHETFGYGKAVFNMKAFKEVLTFVTLFSAVLGNGEFTIHHSPNGINFKGNEPIDSSELPNILTTAMGISSNSDNTWEGLTIQNPFNYPSLAVIVEIEGLPSLKLGDNAYPFRNTISRQLTKEIFTLNLGSRVINEQHNEKFWTAIRANCRGCIHSQ